MCGGTSSETCDFNSHPVRVYPRVCGGTVVMGSWPLGMTQARRVYPRVCGGTLDMDMSDAYELGLSPRVRGNPPQAR